MSEYDLLLIGGFALGVLGTVTLFSATVDGRGIFAPAMTLAGAAVLILLAMREAPGSGVRVSDFGQAFLRLFEAILN